MPYSPHPSFQTPPDRTAVWRYMGFLRFMDLLERQALWF